MKTDKNILFITNIPSFYKVRLYNAIHKHRDVSVIYLNSDRINRGGDFFSKDNDFNIITFSSLSLWSLLIYMLRNIKKYDEIVVGGWDRLHYWLLLLLPFPKISLALESSILDIDKENKFKNFIKRLYLSRISKVYASGTPHKELLIFLKYKKEIVITLGVGLINYPTLVPTKENFAKPQKFLFVGRIEEIKGIDLLISAFTQLHDCELTICGSGSLAGRLDNLKNIKYLGYVNNHDLSEIYREHHVFILPSLVEPWGLVVEEALANWLPVIVSNKVGSAKDIVEDNNVGLVFESNNLDSFIAAIEKIRHEEVYRTLVKNVKSFSVFEKDIYQIQCYFMPK